ncbi:MAG: autotransporter-associated beta strand repeat-containing protein [Burkholderiales bacterium]|nr:autotransporter-associated beta strand repeat-containing protein [Phycisphaerae bacterium]
MFRLIAGMAILGVPVAAHGIGPYTPDANTLQLWHLDGSGANAAGGVNLTPQLGATVTTAGYSGFGTSLSTAVAGSYMGVGAPANVGSGGSDNVNIAIQNATTRAYTFEAVVKLNSTSGGAGYHIISGEGEGADRAWQFRIDPIGMVSGASDNTKVRLEFNNLVGGSQVFATLPDVGGGDPNAPNTTDWFHVAVTYSGTPATAGNMNFYWTKVDPGNTVAALAASVTQANNITINNNGATGGLTNTDFAIGNELRSTGGQTETFNGLIDEVRISSVARANNEFIFGNVTASFWNVYADGNWDNALNWTPGLPGGAIPGAIGAVASFGGGPTPISFIRTVTIDGTKTVGVLNFDAIGFSLVSGTSGAIALDNAAVASVVTVGMGTHFVSVPVSVDAEGATIATSTLSSTLTMSGPITGAGGITKSGAGTLTLSGNNSYAGATTVTGGVLAMTGTNTYGGATIVSGGTLRASDGVGLPTTSNLTLSGGVFETGTNFARVGGSNPGEVQLTTGTTGFSAMGADIQVAIGSLATPTPLVWGTGAFAPTTLVLNTSAATNAIDFKNAIDLGAAARGLQVNANVATLSGQLTGAVGGDLNIGGNTGTGTVVLSNPTNNYDGVTIVFGASVKPTTANGLGSTVGRTYIFGSSATVSEVALEGGITLAEPFELGGKQAAGATTPHIRNISGNNTITGNFTASPNGNQYNLQSDAGLLTISGNYTQTAGTGARFLNLQGAGNGAYSGAISDGTAIITVTKKDAGTWTLSGANTYTGATNANGGKLVTVNAVQNNAAMGITNNAVLEVPTSGGASGVTSIGALTIAPNGGNYAGTLQLHDNDLVVNNGVYADILAMVKSGLPLLGFGGDGTGITSAEVIAQGAGGVGLNGTMLGVVDGALAGGQVTSLSGFTVANPTTSVLVKYTWRGDANLDGIVNGSDYALADTGFSGGGTGWFYGDVNYDGVINGSDYALIDTGFSSQTGPLPEPAMLSLLGLGAMGMLRRRRFTA